MHEAFDSIFDANKCTERHELGDATWNDLAHCVGAGELLPRIFLRGLERQRDTLAVHVDVEGPRP